MSNLYKIHKHLKSIKTALENVEYGRMPVKHLEDVFEDRIESVRNLIQAEHFNRESNKKNKNEY